MELRKKKHRASPKIRASQGYKTQACVQKKILSHNPNQSLLVPRTTALSTELSCFSPLRDDGTQQSFSVLTSQPSFARSLLFSTEQIAALQGPPPMHRKSLQRPGRFNFYSYKYVSFSARALFSALWVQHLTADLPQLIAWSLASGRRGTWFW